MFSSRGIAASAPPGQVEFTTPGTFNWTCPPGVFSVCVVAVGSGAHGGVSAEGGGGGGLGWKNNIPVIPGQSYLVSVSGPGTGTDSYFINASTVRGGRASSSIGGSWTGDGGGWGGGGGTAGDDYHYAGGGGAGGYSGNGGTGCTADYSAGTYAKGTDGSGGAGAGGANISGLRNGGGVGLKGQGANGIGNIQTNAGVSGSNGIDPTPSTAGKYGGGSGSYGGASGSLGGAVRIIWGKGRAFPSTNTGDM